MWYFRSPEIVFGEESLDHLENLSGNRAFIVTDPMMIELGFVELVGGHLKQAGMVYGVFSDVEAEPSVQTVVKGAEKMSAFEPDWIIGLGGGSAMDAAKAMWVMYANPDMRPEDINPFEPMGLRDKARLIAIPTTSGTGSEATWAAVISEANGRKMGLNSPELIPDLAIVDPVLAQKMPPRLTADTGLDVLTHAIEGYTCTLRNDFSDGLSLKAIELVFNYLPRAFSNGDDMEARERMHNAAAIAGLSFSNAMPALAHSLGHSLGAVFKTPHGRAVALFLPYTIQFIDNGDVESRFHELSRFLGLPAGSPKQGADSLVQAIRELSAAVGQPLTIKETIDVSQEAFEASLDQLVAFAEADSVIVMGDRVPSAQETYKLFQYAYEGKDIDF